MKKLFILIPAFLLLVSCGSNQTTEASPVTIAPSAEKGLAVGTITFEADTPVNEIYRFFYNATSGDKKFQKANAGKIVITARQKEGKGFAGEFGNQKSYLVVIEREAGSYAFTQYTYLNRLGPTGEVSYSNPFSIPFDIKKGGITYFGELNYVDQAVKGTPRIFVADYFDRDMAEFKKKYPSLGWDSAENKTAKTGNTGEGTVDFRN